MVRLYFETEIEFGFFHSIPKNQFWLVLKLNCLFLSENVFSLLMAVNVSIAIFAIVFESIRGLIIGEIAPSLNYRLSFLLFATSFSF